MKNKFTIAQLETIQALLGFDPDIPPEDILQQLYFL